MITLDDMEDMCSLTREEIAQVAKYAHITEEAAVAEIERLMHEHGGLHWTPMICPRCRSFMLFWGFLEEHGEAMRAYANRKKSSGRKRSKTQ